MKNSLSLSGHEVSAISPTGVAAVCRKFCGDSFIEQFAQTSVLNMPASHPPHHVADGNDSANDEPGTNASTEPSLNPQVSSDLTALASETLNQVRQAYSDRKGQLVFMSFFRENGWRCTFWSADRATILRQLVFRSAYKIIETARRGRGIANEIDRLCLEKEIATGKGGVWLKLTEKQYKSVCRR